MKSSKSLLAVNPGHRLLSPRQASTYLGCSEKTLSDWREMEIGPAWIRVGNKLVRYDETDLITWLARRKHLCDAIGS